MQTAYTPVEGGLKSGREGGEAKQVRALTNVGLWLWKDIHGQRGKECELAHAIKGPSKNVLVLGLGFKI
jgi:hypothetical protein